MLKAQFLNNFYRLTFMVGGNCLSIYYFIIDNFRYTVADIIRSCNLRLSNQVQHFDKNSQ